jgi:hypothetical protein
LLLFGANILLSPEVAVAFALAWLVYSVLMVRRHGRPLAVSLLAFIAAGLLCWLLLPAAYYGSLLRFSEGGQQSAVSAGSASAAPVSEPRRTRS